MALVMTQLPEENRDREEGRTPEDEDAALEHARRRRVPQEPLVHEQTKRSDASTTRRLPSGGAAVRPERNPERREQKGCET